MVTGRSGRRGRMSIDTWVTLVAYDTPFLAQLATDRLDEAGIANRTLSDSGGGSLPHVDFGAGGHRVQVDRQDLDAAREMIVALPDAVMDDLDVGRFSEDPDGVLPDPGAARAGPARRQHRRWLRLAAVVLIVVMAAMFIAGPLDLLPRMLEGTIVR